MNSKMVEIRSYNLRPGTRCEFARVMAQEAVPMLRRWEVDVVAFGASPHDDNSYYLIRAYANLNERQRSQDAFYGSKEWLEGPRERVLAAIESYTSVVIEMSQASIAGLRRRG